MTKKLDFADIKESTGFEPLPEGMYVIKITDVEDDEANERFWATFDIAEGPHTGFFSDQWGVDHPKSHRLMFSYKESAAGMLKSRLHMLTDSNPGFDAEAAYNGNIKLFVGKLLGIAVANQEHEYKGNVSLRIDFFHSNICKAQDVRDGTAKMPKHRDRNGQVVDEAEWSEILAEIKPYRASTSADDTMDDVPF